jgi:tetratricopeptide (TPR) repeat protein
VNGDLTKFQKAMAYAEQASQQGKWAEAAKAYRFALAEFPNNEAAITGFGKAALSLNQFQVAQTAFQQALKVNPTNPQTLNYVGDVQERQGQLDAAAETYLRIGNIYAGQGDFEAAIDSWTRATKLSPGKLDAYRKLADLLAQQNKRVAAARQLLSMAAIHQRRNNPEVAMQYIQEAGGLVPHNPGIAAALEALQTGSRIQPDQITDTPAPMADAALDFDFSDEHAGDDFFDAENDPFALDDTLSSTSQGGLLAAAKQKAVTELASVAFEDEANSNVLFIMQAIDLQSRNNLAKASDIYRQAIQSGEKRAALYFNLGVLYTEQENYNEATAMLKISAQDDGYDVPSQFALGKAYYRTNDLESAVRRFMLALKIIDLRTVSGHKATTLAQKYDRLIQEYAGEGKNERVKKFITAIEAFFAISTWERKVLRARQSMDNFTEENEVMSLAEFLETPETEIAITAMSATNEYMRRNLLMTALEECLWAIQKAPLHLPLHVRLGDILLKQERTDEAITKYLYIAKVYQVRNIIDQAVNTYQKILRLAPMDVTVRSKLIDLYISRNNKEQALEQYMILADSYYQLAQVDRALEKYNEALRLTSTLTNSTSWKTDILNRIGDIYTQRFDWAKAASAYEELIQVNPQDDTSRRRLIELYFKQGKISPALKALDGLLSLYQRQNPLKALELLKDLSGVYPEDMALRQRLAIAYVQNGKTQEAIAEYDALGEMQLERGLRDQAAQTIQAILNLGPEDAEGYQRLLEKIGGGEL